VFERFTAEARNVVVHAQQEARTLRHPFIGTEHLLLGMLTGGGPAGELLAKQGLDADRLRRQLIGSDPTRQPAIDAEALAVLGIDLDQVRQAVEARFGPGALVSPPRRMPQGHLPFTRSAKKSLELALREAAAAGAGAINSAHLVLGITGCAEGTGVRLLRGLGVDLDELTAAARRRAAANAA
jgi:ATP-dependent Clp protease ATP-binding subunit ClpA